MSRSNGPIGQAGGTQPSYKRTVADQDPANRAANPQGHDGHPGQRGAPVQPPRHAPAAFGSLDPGYPVNGQGYDQHPGHNNSAYPNQPAFQQQPGYYPASAPAAGQPSYQPVFDRYSPIPDPLARAPDPSSRGYDIRAQHPRTAPPQPQPYAPPQSPSPAFDPQDAYRGAAFDQWPQNAAQPSAPHLHPARSYAPQPHAPAASAPQGYDFSNYAAASAQDHNSHAYNLNRQPANQAPPPHDLPQSHNQQVPPADDEGQWQLAGAYDRRNDLPPEPNRYQNPHDLAVDPLALENEASGQLQHADDLAYDQDDLPDYEDDEPRKGRRGLIMVSALVGAIALGGGMAYAYKTFIKPSSGGQVAKVSAPKGPAKTAPADPGGKQFPNQESKLQERLGDGTAAPAGTAASGPAPNLGETDGVQRVRTVTVGRDGTLSAPAQTASAIPGMVVQMPPAQAQQAAPVATPPSAPIATASVSQPRVVVPQARTVVAAAAEVAPPEVSAPVALKRVTPPKKSLATRDDLVASNGVPSAATIAPPASVKAGGTGFVAVVASKANKADAQKANVDLEQRFDVLKGKIFDVQEADLTAQGRGVVYRSVVGPPGSRAFANGICEQLKTVGYTDCWPVKYN